MEKTSTLQGEVIPIDDRCEECADAHSDCFDWLDWEAFCAVCAEHDGMKRVVQQWKASKSDAAELASKASVKRKYKHVLEISQDVQILNETELLSSLKMSTMPKHMKSIPSMEVPVAPASLDEVAYSVGGEQQFETVYCFSTPHGATRTARLITSIGFEDESEELPTQCFPGHSRVLADARMLQLRDKTRHGIVDLRSNTLKLITLSEFVDQKQRKPKITKLSNERPSGQDDDKGSSDEGNGGDVDSDSGSTAASDSGSNKGDFDDDDSHASKSPRSEPGSPLSPASKASVAMSVATPTVKTFNSLVSSTRLSRAGSSLGRKGSATNVTTSECADDDVQGGAEAMMKEKMRILPLTKVILGEPKGGWGRSIRGAERCEASFRKQPDHINLANELSRYLEAVVLARALQPDKLSGVDDAKMRIALTNFKKMNFEIPPSLQGAFLARRVSQFRRRIQDSEATQESVDELLKFMLPWRLDDTPCPFDFGSPRSCDATHKSVNAVEIFRETPHQQNAHPWHCCGEEGRKTRAALAERLGFFA